MLAEIHDEWAVDSERRYLSEASMKLITSRTDNPVNGDPVEPYTRRVTHIYRRENDEWKIAHRHADYVPIDQTL